MKSSSIITSILIASASLLFVQCGGKKSDNTEQSTKDTVVADQPEFFDYPIPTSFEITEMLNKAGAAYIFNVTNDPKNVDRYTTERSKALNLGIYGADLSYSSTYNMKQETMLFLEASKKLMDQLEINTSFNKTFGERLEKNIENKDSTIEIITASIKDTYNYLKSNNKDNLSLLVMAGSLIEGLHISVQMAQLTTNNAEILKIIAGQKNTITEIVGLMEPSKDVADISDIFTQFKKLEALYANVTDTVNAKQLADISKLVEEMRASFVK